MGLHDDMLDQIRTLCQSHARIDDKISRVCQLLYGIEGYEWVGYFFLDQERGDRLVLGSYAGEAEPPRNILLGKGVCGQAAEREITIVQGDVSQELNYVRISDRVQSEIVLPLFRSAKLAGVLSVQSHEKNRFDEHDRLFLEEVCLLLTDQI